MEHNYTEPTPGDSRFLVIDVFIDALDIEDALAPPPVVGSDTTWLLRFHLSDRIDARAFPGHPTWLRELHALRSGGITAYVANPPVDPLNSAPLTGKFSGTMLGGSTPDRLPTTTGSILGLHIRSEVYREIRPQHWSPVPGSATLRRVSSSPKWFDRGTMTSGSDCRRDTGLIVQMAVLGVGQSPDTRVR